MAAIHHQIEYWTWSLAPGGALWLSYGPDERYKNGSVQVSCCPSTQVGETTVHRTQTLTVPEIYITQVPHVSGDIVSTSAYAGFNIVNAGTDTVRYFSICLTVVNA